MLDFLPDNLKSLILNSLNTVFEVRLRLDQLITVKGLNDGQYTTKTLSQKVTIRDLERIIMNLSCFSVYSVEESLSRGFITSKQGERVGVCGECITSNGSVTSIKNFTSVCIRIPNDIRGCSKGFYKNIDEAKSCLIFSPPFHGKTTFLRDLGRAYSNEFKQDVLFVDERDELSAGDRFDLGKNSDCIKYSPKQFAFYFGIRNLNPTVIACDEIMSDSDCQGIEFASLSGVKVVATCHSNKIENLVKKENISKILKKNIFEYLIEIESGKIKNIYGEKQWLKYI